MMRLSAIVAASDNEVIGNKGNIPWSIKDDQRRVKEITMGYPLIMGRKTHESIGRTLPGRLNIVISRNPNFQPYEGAVLVNSLEEALNLQSVKTAKEAFIFGGETIYQQAMPHLQRIYLTRVHATVPGDSFFKFDAKLWRLKHSESRSKDPPNGTEYDYDYQVLERI